MDILTDTVVWLVEEASDLLLSLGAWASDTFIWFLDWISENTIAGLQSFADLSEWVIDNPTKAATNTAIVVCIVLLVLAIEIYIYDLIKRRQPTGE